MKVLIVDDNGYDLDKLKRHVEGLGHEVVTASDGREATNILMPIDDSLTPSIGAIVTDTRMGEYSGVYLLQFINRNDPPPTLLHSTDTTFTYKGTEFDLPVVIPDAFGFAQFHLKGDDLSYITEFLTKLA